jgi:hypothetical protein
LNRGNEMHASEMKNGVRKRNTGACNVAISRANLAIRENVARIQAAGSERFVK